MSFKVTTASMAEQTERAFQKQANVFLNSKERLLGIGRKAQKSVRQYRTVGLGFKVPKEAKNGTYIDKKCPFTGNVTIHGRILTGVVRKTKMTRTIVIRREYLHYVKKYRRYEKRHSNMSVHCSPCFRVEVGDVVTVGQCRPLTKTVSFVVLKVNSSTGTRKAFDKF